jgi:hypothetical protein
MKAKDEQRQPWERRQNETPTAYQCFLAHRDHKGRRSIKIAAELCGANYGTARNWAVTHEWAARVAAWDAREARDIESAMEKVRTKSRGILLDNADMAAEVILGMIADPTTKQSVRLNACVRVLELVGLTVPKRVELSGPDGGDVEVTHRAAASKATTEALLKAVRILEEGSGE